MLILLHLQIFVLDLRERLLNQIARGRLLNHFLDWQRPRDRLRLVRDRHRLSQRQAHLLEYVIVRLDEVHDVRERGLLVGGLGRWANTTFR